MRTLVSERWLTRPPCALVLALVWPDLRPSRAWLWWVLSAVRPALSTERVFRTRGRGGGRPASAASCDVGAQVTQHRRIMGHTDVL